MQRQLKQEFGFRTIDAAIRTQYASERLFADEAVMLTGDLNVAVVEWIVQYRVADPYLFLFKVRNLADTFRAMNEAVMREVVGDRTVTEVLTVGRQEIESRVGERLQSLANQYEMGITIDQVVLQDVNPPDPGQAVVGRGEPGAAATRPDDQRGPGRVQPRHPAGPRRGGADGAAGRRLRARPREPLRG